jgi:hypothetical protein
MALAQISGQGVILGPVGKAVQNHLCPCGGQASATPSPIPEFDPVMTARLPANVPETAMTCPLCCTCETCHAESREGEGSVEAMIHKEKNAGTRPAFSY